VTETDDKAGGPPESDAPDTLGRFELLTKFATGGMAELFLARERGVGGLERVVVIKRLLSHLADDPASVDMFLREARLVARLNHPNVVQTYELGEQQGDYFLAMEYLHGSTLRELQRLADEEDESLPLPIAISAIERAARGLHAAHELRDFDGNLVGLIHRDVSPQNLICTDEGYVKLLDFGVAKAAEGKEATYSGHIKGKFSYMSPEQLNREQLDRRSDIFALGIVTWELCTGERLFDRDGEYETMKAITEEEPPPPSSVAPSIPEELDAIVARALQKDREDRFQTVEQMRQRLQEAGERRDLLRDEAALAEYVDAMAGEHLERRRETLREALDRSLTADERARLRHEQAVRSASGVSDGRASVDRSPSSPGDGIGRESSTSDPGEATRVARPSAEAPSSRSDVPEKTSPSTRQLARRWQIWLASAAVLLLIASAILTFWEPGGDGTDASAPAPEDLSGPPLTFGVPPFETEEILRRDLDPILRYLERETGRPFELLIGDDYGEASLQLRNDQVDFAMLTPLLFIRTRRAEPTIQPIAVREFGGSVTGNGLLLVLSSADVQSLEQLRGATFCLTDKNSTTGNFLPRALIRRHGYEPRTFIGDVHWSGNHLQVFRDLIDGKCKVAATYSGSFLTADSHGIPIGRVRQIAVTGHTPSDTIVARPGLETELVDRVRTALLNFDPGRHAGAEAVGSTLQITGFQEPREEPYRSLEKEVNENLDILRRFNFPGVDPPAAGDAGLDAGGDPGLDATEPDAGDISAGPVLDTHPPRPERTIDERRRDTRSLPRTGQKMSDRF